MTSAPRSPSWKRQRLQSRRPTTSTRTRRRRSPTRTRQLTTTTSTTSKLATRGGAAPPQWNVFGHDESLFRTGFLKLSVMALKRHWSKVNALQHIITQRQQQQQATCSMCVQQCQPIWCLRLRIQCPSTCKTRSPQSPFCAADFHCRPSILMDAWKSLLLLQSYKCLLMVLRGMSKAGCFLWVFVHCNRKEFSTSVSHAK